MKKKALFQLIANLLMWLCVPVIISGIAIAQSGSPAVPFPTTELLKLVAPSQLLLFLGAGLIYFLFFAFIRHRSKKTDEQNRAIFFADLGFDEMASALYSFGSILAVCTFVGAAVWYFLPALVCYGLGYYLKPPETASH